MFANGLQIYKIFITNNLRLTPRLVGLSLIDNLIFANFCLPGNFENWLRKSRRFVVA